MKNPPWPRARLHLKDAIPAATLKYERERAQRLFEGMGMAWEFAPETGTIEEARQGLMAGIRPNYGNAQQSNRPTIGTSIP